MQFRNARILAVAVTAAAAVVGAAAPAQAVAPPDGKVQALAAAGSDTTQDVIGAVLSAYAADKTANPDGDKSVNVPPLPATPFTVPGDATCAARTYVSANANPPQTFLAPNGSTAGKNALKEPANLTSACIDIARSSSGPSAGDPAQFEYYGFAKDAVSWGRFAGNAPANLTIAQLRGIYNCTFTNWSQVGGQNAPIVRYNAQAGSGTHAFFVGTVLGFEPSTACGEVKAIQENDGSAVATADRPNAILPYSVAQWVAQGNNAVPDIRSSALIGTLDGENPVKATGNATTPWAPNAAVINGSTFEGVRTVYNVVDTRLPSYEQAKRIVGFDEGGPGYLCAGTASLTTLLTRFGFTPLEADLFGNTCTLA